MEPLKLKAKVAAHRNACTALYDLETGPKTISQWVRKVEELSKKASSRNDEDEINKFKGDMLEIFSELFFRSFQNDPEVGLREFVPIAPEEDFGVDAIGVNVNNDQCAIQVKYRANPTDEIGYTDIAKTYTSARIFNKISLDNDDTIFLFTTSRGANYICNSVFKGKLRVIGRGIIAGKVDNNNSFWSQVENMIGTTLDHLFY